MTAEMRAAEHGSARGKGRRAIVMVIDGCGIGAAPDAADFGDPADCNTIANVADRLGGISLPTMEKLGLGNITQVKGVSPLDECLGHFGKLKESSNGKDTQTGHWEMMGIVSPQAFPLYPDGFPREVVDRFIAESGCQGILANKPASGTEILEELGEEHRRSGYPIVYTSGDSVFQIAAHVDVVPLDKLYKWCETARRILDGPHRVGRVIARPFKGTPGNYVRLGGERRDYAVPPPKKTFLDELLADEVGVFGIGKIEDIFVKHGLSHAKHTGTNLEGLKLTLEAIQDRVDLEPLKLAPQMPDAVKMIFTNLVDTDSLYGHRRNVRGYGEALVEIDAWLKQILEAMQPEDLLIISSDHGNDPTAPGTDHTREFVPLLCYSPILADRDHPLNRRAANVGTREGFVDIAATLGDWLGMKWKGPGVSFLAETHAAV
ncbi:MAG TPA: phosphopentomutase [Candidatus Obscuribacterales bacterium]